jgi:hypothetical protein
MQVCLGNGLYAQHQRSEDEWEKVLGRSGRHGVARSKYE